MNVMANSKYLFAENSAALRIAAGPDNHRSIRGWLSKSRTKHETPIRLTISVARHVKRRNEMPVP